MEILDYSKRVVCFKDYKLRDKTIFLEADVGEREFESCNLGLCLKYNPKETINLNGNFRGSSISITQFRAARADKPFTSEDLVNRVIDADVLTNDPIIIRELRRKLQEQKSQ